MVYPKQGIPKEKTDGRRVHSRNFKLTVVLLLANGEKHPAQICREHNLAFNVVSRWRNEYEKLGDEAFLPPASSEPASAEARIAEEEGASGALLVLGIAFTLLCQCFRLLRPGGLFCSIEFKEAVIGERFPQQLLWFVFCCFRIGLWLRLAPAQGMERPPLTVR